MRANTVLFDFARDMWSYISLGYFRQRPVEGESAPQPCRTKSTPIDFENAEGNLGLANALLATSRTKLPVSRLQRDLTTRRCCATSAWRGTQRLPIIAQGGLGKLELDVGRLGEDLERAWRSWAKRCRRYAGS